MSDLKFSHVSALDISQHEYLNLGKLGFSIPDVEGFQYPGSLVCRFIYFENGASVELLEIKNKDQFRQTFSENIKIYGSEQFSAFKLIANKSLRKYFNENRNTLESIGAKFSHQNYDWTNTTEELPGWNFVTTDTALLPGVEISLLEYEKYTPKKNEKPKPSPNKNGVNRLLGLYFCTENEKSIANFLKFTALDITHERIQVGDPNKTTFWVDTINSPNPVCPSLLSKNKGSLKAVVLQCNDLNLFISTYRIKDKIVFAKREAALISFGQNQFDWVIVGP